MDGGTGGKRSMGFNTCKGDATGGGKVLGATIPERIESVTRASRLEALDRPETPSYDPDCLSPSRMRSMLFCRHSGQPLDRGLQDLR